MALVKVFADDRDRFHGVEICLRCLLVIRIEGWPTIGTPFAGEDLLKLEGIGYDACRSILSMSLTTRSFNLASYADVSINSLRTDGGVSGDLTVVVGSCRAEALRVVAGFVKPACFHDVNFSSESAMSFRRS